MNAVEIEEAVSQLIEDTVYDPEEFPFLFLEAFGNKATTIKKLRKVGRGSSNKTDVAWGVGGVEVAVLQRTNIHLATCAVGSVGDVVRALEASPATAKQKCKYVLATDGREVQAIALNAGEPLACDYAALPDYFAFFLELAGISTVREIKENAFDIRATARLNKLYVELLKVNKDWDGEDRRQDLNHFFARLIFCFFAEDTNIFVNDAFTDTVHRISDPDAGNVHEVLAECFRAMNTDYPNREAAGVARYAKRFPYVNGGLFGGPAAALQRSGPPEGPDAVPRFNKAARSYLLHIGSLDWKRINPDIFGSMIQAVADEGERAHLGMHYTSVPNILKVLNPLFLDGLRQNLEACGEGRDQGSKRKLLNLRRRLTRIRVFDPACGSGNFLVIAYKELRKIEAAVNERRGEPHRDTDIPLTNFRGIEIRHFATEIARLALVIAEYQCNVLYQGETLAVKALLPLTVENWITHGNALRLDWEVVCPPFGKTQQRAAEDLFDEGDETEIAFENEGGEVYVCGNPPYLGSRNQSAEQKLDMDYVFRGTLKKYKSLDYVCCWLMKGASYLRGVEGRCALVATNSIVQGQSVSIFWPHIIKDGLFIGFAHRSFYWSNNASHKAAVVCVVVSIECIDRDTCIIYDGKEEIRTEYINFYLSPGKAIAVDRESKPLNSALPIMNYGNKSADSGHLILSNQEASEIASRSGHWPQWIRSLVGSKEFFAGTFRHCLWIDKDQLHDANQVPEVSARIDSVYRYRISSKDSGLNAIANRPHQFRDRLESTSHSIFIPGLSSERREYTPCDVINPETIISITGFSLYDEPIFWMSLLSSRLNYSWNATVSGKMKTDIRYSNTLGWNTFPVPTLTTQNKADLTACAEGILLARERYWPATIAEMYDPKRMDAEFPEVRAAHERNDEVLEEIYIGRRFRNDTERLEVLFGMYEEMVGAG